MFGNFVLLLNLIGLSFSSGFLSGDIDVRINAPQQVRAGDKFQVTVSIDKSSLQGFSRFQQILPYGLTAEKVTSSNADFSFENQRIRFIWLKLPQDNTITLVYNVMVEDILKGSFRLAGEFSYIEGNTRKAINASTDKEILIIPGKLIPDSLLVDIKDYEAVIMSRMQAEIKLASLTVQRKDPVQISPREYRVEMKISKGNLKRFAKLEEYIPQGYTAAEGDSKSGIFSFQDQTMKILWMDVPEEPEFVISYRLFKNLGTAAGSPNISGNFSYISGNKTQNIEIIQKNYDLAVLTSGDTVRNLAVPVKREAESRSRIQGGEKSTDVQVSTVLSQDINTIGGDSGLKPEKGLYYRVQLLASHDELDVNSHFRELKLILKVRIENHDGLKKYTVGSFSNYKDAADYCSHIWKNTKIKDAFIVAYYNGRRIPVKEALMMQKP